MTVAVHFEDSNTNDVSISSIEDANITEKSRIEISYDGGRLDIYVDGKIYKTSLAGNDFSVILENLKN